MNIISVDLQKDFSDEQGVHFRPRPCVGFVRETLLPFVASRKIPVAEINSDYRPPRPHYRNLSCVPGTAGFESEIPVALRHADVWVKSLNSPSWTRDNAGVAGSVAGTPYADPEGFTNWLHRTVGAPQVTPQIVLIGLTLDCCVLCTAQELYFRGYSVRYLAEAVDTYSGKQEEKEFLFRSSAGNWASPLSWHDFQKACEIT